MLIQLVKRSPLDLRPALGIEPRVDAASLAHVLSAHSRLGATAAGSTGERIAAIAGRLEALRSPACPEPCWGYHFDVETRFFFYPAGGPNTIATAFAGHALLDAHAATGRPELLELAVGAGEFFLRRVGTTTGSGGGFFGYFPGDRTPIHNASALASALLARLAERTGRPDLGEAARLGIGFALHHQRDDGSWPYAEGGVGSWVDNFHTGYVLDALRLSADASRGPEIEAAWRRGLRLYDERLFLADGTPKVKIDSVHPIDGQCAAQAIRTFALAAADDGRWLERAWRSYGFAIARLRRGDGAFAFQRHRLWTNRLPHVRWVQAPMLDALSRLLVAGERWDAA